MIGRKRLGTIRKEIEEALSSGGENPIQSLERQIATAKRRGNGTEVMEGLKRFLSRRQSRNAANPGLTRRSEQDRKGGQENTKIGGERHDLIPVRFTKTDVASSISAPSGVRHGGDLAGGQGAGWPEGSQIPA